VLRRHLEPGDPHDAWPRTGSAIGEVAAQALDDSKLCCRLRRGEVRKSPDLLGQLVEAAPLLVAQRLLLGHGSSSDCAMERGVCVSWLVEAQGLGDGSIGAPPGAQLDHSVVDRLLHGLSQRARYLALIT
jgi:hypothetical protein